MKHFPVDYNKVHKNFIWRTLGMGDQQISSYKVLVRKQNHRGEESLAFRFSFSDGNELAYVTDSEPSQKSIDFVSSVGLLLHEWEFTGRKKLAQGEIKLEGQIHDGHVTTVGACLIAKRAKVGKLVLIHHHPFADEKQLNSQLKLARSIFPRTELAADLKAIHF
jgi:ribonuclease BN (tRNA processing enzyme)